MITGPGSPSVLSNMVVSIEQHVAWVSACLEHMRAQHLDVVEPTPTAEAGWVQHVNDAADITLYPRADSWYMGANVPGKPRVFLPYVGGVDRYRKLCDEVVRRDYLGFAFDGPGGARCQDGVVARLQVDVAAVLDFIAESGTPPFETLSVAGARALSTDLAALRPPGPAVGDVHDGELPGAAGPLRHRRYRPATPGPHPIVVYFHGGGWVLGGADSDDAFCRDLCVRSNAVVVSVDYRHAPEARFPAAVDDGFAAVRWIAANADALGGRPGELAVCGWSAGGNVAAVVCQMARDAGGPRIAGQVLVTPVDGLRLHTRVLRGQRRGPRPHHRAHAVVLGPLRRSGRASRSQSVAAAGPGSLGPTPRPGRHLRVRPAARRGHRLRRGARGGRRRRPAPPLPRPDPHVAAVGGRDPVGERGAGGDRGGVARVLRPLYP